MSGDTVPQGSGASGAAPYETSERDGRTTTVLLDQFYVTLRSIQRAIDRNPPVSSDPDAIRDRIDNLFKVAQSWPNAYEIEQLQCHLFAAGRLDTEITRRFEEADSRKLASAVALKALLGPPEKWHEVSEDKKRAVLHRLVNDLQWFYTQRFQRRRTARVLNQRVSKVFLAAFAVLLTVLIAQLILLPTATESPTSTSPTTSGGR
jgi:hypothetical protein